MCKYYTSPGLLITLKYAKDRTDVLSDLLSVGRLVRSDFTPNAWAYLKPYDM